MNSRPSFYIEYGWISGHHHGRELGRLLEREGLVETTTSHQADIIIAHSAGYYLLPSHTNAKLFFLVGPTLNKLSFANWGRANIENAKMFWRDHYVRKGVRLNLWHLADIFLHPCHNFRIARATKKARLPLSLDRKVIVIANRKDPWPRPSYLNTIIEQQPWVFVSLEGAHENIWEQPENYVEIINHYAKRLLATPK